MQKNTPHFMKLSIKCGVVKTSLLLIPQLLPLLHKNMNTDIALLDAAIEEMNNSIFRKGHIRLGFSFNF